MNKRKVNLTYELAVASDIMADVVLNVTGRLTTQKNQPEKANALSKANIQNIIFSEVTNTLADFNNQGGK